MKKLMFAAMAVALAGAASAVEAYTYKASIKHTYLKPKATTRLLNTTIAKTTVMVKYTKTTTLDGYLIQDDQELLRQSGLSAITGVATELQPGNRCFLVVRNKGAEKGYRAARILPGVIDVKWYDDKLTAPGSSPAQGYLYIGGEIVTGAYRGTTFNALDGVEVATYAARTFGEWQRTGRVPTIGIDDYFFTSAYLFGQYNEPSWQGGVVEEYSDTWMNHAGLGKAGYYNTIKFCCNRGTGGAGTVLESLAGNLKAGFYICTENGDNETHSQTIVMGVNAWPVKRTGLLEDQLWKGVRVNDATIPALTAAYAKGVNYKGAFQLQSLDMWGDGNLDLRTTDVGSGTWSIKRTTSLQSVALTDNQIAQIQTTWAYPTDYNGATGTTKPLIDAINGALVALKTGNPLLGNVFDVDVSGKSNAQALINYSFYTNYLR